MVISSNELAALSTLPAASASLGATGCSQQGKRKQEGKEGAGISRVVMAQEHSTSAWAAFIPNVTEFLCSNC